MIFFIFWSWSNPKTNFTHLKLISCLFKNIRHILFIWKPKYSFTSYNIFSPFHINIFFKSIPIEWFSSSIYKSSYSIFFNFAFSMMVVMMVMVPMFFIVFMMVVMVSMFFMFMMVMITIFIMMFFIMMMFFFLFFIIISF